MAVGPMFLGLPFGLVTAFWFKITGLLPDTSKTGTASAKTGIPGTGIREGDEYTGADDCDEQQQHPQQLSSPQAASAFAFAFYWA